jgi:hypothetical protein
MFSPRGNQNLEILQKDEKPIGATKESKREISQALLSVMMSASDLRALIQRMGESATSSCKGSDIGGVKLPLAKGVGILLYECDDSTSFSNEDNR